MSPQSRQSCHSCTQHVISSCSTFIPTIIKIFRRVFVLQSRDKKSNSNTRRGDNSKREKAKVVIYDMSSGPVLHYYQISSKYSKECSTYIADTKSIDNQCQIKQREIIAKVRKAELSFFKGTRRRVLFYSSIRYHQNILKGIQVTEQTRNLFQTKQMEITLKLRKPELSFLYSTRHVVLLYICTMYHKNIVKTLCLTERTQYQSIITVKYNKGR